MKKLISIIIPAYNEEEALPLCFERVTKLIDSVQDYDFEVLLVDDGSRDRTVEIVKAQREKDPRFCYLSFSRNFGKETAIIAGLDYCKGDAAVLIDADLQDPPEVIPELIQWWEQGYDDVYARRRSRKGETWLKKFTSKMYYKVLQKMTRVQIQIDTGDFRLLDRRCINALRKLRETSRNSKSLFSWIGYHKKEVYYDRDPRVAGKTKWNYKKLIDLAIDGITCFTTSPLRIATYLSIPSFLLGFAYFVYLIVTCIVRSVWPRTNQLILLLLITFAATVILLIGLLGEYLGRIFTQAKGRPLYLVDEYNGEKERNELR